MIAHVPEGEGLQFTVEENLEMGVIYIKVNDIKEDIGKIYRRFPRLKERRQERRRAADVAIGRAHEQAKV